MKYVELSQHECVPLVKCISNYLVEREKQKIVHIETEYREYREKVNGKESNAKDGYRLFCLEAERVIKDQNPSIKQREVRKLVN